MSNPYRLSTPAVVSFSGGRTSGFMLHEIALAFDWSLPDDLVIVFNNTGKERLETLDFVHEIETRWGLTVVWLEYRYLPERLSEKDSGHSFVIVDYATASRNGEPFDALLRHHASYRETKDADPVLPNPVQRFCTSELKIRTQKRYLKSLGWEEWDAAIGLRADEPRRVAKIKNSMAACVTPVCPLAKAGVTEEMILAWWKAQPFDLQLQPHEGNCDLCFLKRRGNLAEILSRRPDLGEWWAQQEEWTGATFRRDRPRYSLMMTEAQQPSLFCDMPDDGEMDCNCTD